MDNKENHNNKEAADNQNLDQYRELEIDLNRLQTSEEIANDLSFNRKQITHNREG